MLKDGESGSDVQDLIVLLEMHGFLEPQASRIEVYNGKIRNAIRTVQCFGGLEVTGHADSRTVDFLTAWPRHRPRIRRILVTREYSWTRSIKKDMTGADVRDFALLAAIQGIFEKHRISHLNTTETIYDKEMELAVRRLQQKAGLPVTGVADAAAIKALIDLYPLPEGEEEADNKEKNEAKP